MILKTKLGTLVFGQDMMIDLPYITDWKSIGQCRQESVNQDNQCKNAGSVDFNYAIGQKVLLGQEEILCKAQTPYLGPYLIIHVHTDVKIRIQ